MSDQIEFIDTVENLPLDAWHRARGARMVEFAEYHMPIQYEGIMAEHLWTRESAGLFDVSHMGQLLFSADGFVQVLEGPTEAVERTFERIECDPRHAHVVILEAGPAAAREFQNWSMAYAGRDADQHFAAFSRAPRTACPEALALLRAALDRMTPEQAAAA